MKTFKHSDYISIGTPVNSPDYSLFKGIVDQGIDSHLEAFTKSQFFFDCGKFHFHFHKSEKSILLRRLTEVMNNTVYDDTWVQCDRWIEDIKDYDKIIAD